MDIVATHARTAASALRKMNSVYADWVDQCADAHEENNKLNHQVERLRFVLASILSACEDVNSPDRKVRKEIARTVGKALKEKE